jgi:hypothetical protein
MDLRASCSHGRQKVLRFCDRILLLSCVVGSGGNGYEGLTIVEVPFGRCSMIVGISTRYVVSDESDLVKLGKYSLASPFVCSHV